MKTEISAGGIVIRKKGTVWLVLLIRDMNSNWTFPKGIIEKAEDARTAAAREIAEETGLTGLHFSAPLSTITYMYQRNGLIRKTVHYFLFMSPEDSDVGLVPQTQEGISEARWMDIREAQTVIGYPRTNAKLLEEAINKINSL